MRVIEIMIADWQELVKYHRKRTLTSLLNYDLLLSDKLMKGKYTYRMIVETQFPTLVRIENDGFNDNEIGIPHQKVSVKDEALTMKDLQVTIDSETHSEDKVELSQQASQFYHDTIRTLHLVKECTDRLQQMFAEMSSIIKQYQSRGDLVKLF